MEWQDIATAPRDGTHILVHFRTKGWREVFWCDPWDYSPDAKHPVWCVDDDKYGPYPLRGYRDGEDEAWMPLPPPPGQKETQP